MEKADSWVLRNCKFAQQQVQQRQPTIVPPRVPPKVPPMATQPGRPQAQTQEVALVNQAMRLLGGAVNALNIAPAMQMIGQAGKSLEAAMNTEEPQHQLHRVMLQGLLKNVETVSAQVQQLPKQVTALKDQVQYQLNTILTKGEALPPVDLEKELGLK